MNDRTLAGSTLVEADRRHLIHSLHHPKDHAAAKIFIDGKGAMLRTADGAEYIDGLSALWNVNIGHGRRELASAAATQMEKLGCAAAYAGCEPKLWDRVRASPSLTGLDPATRASTAGGRLPDRVRQ